MSIWTKIKWGFGAAVSLALTALYVLLGRRTAQRDEAKRERDTEKRSHKATQAKASDDADIRRAGAQARQESADARRERNEQTTEERRTGRQLGDHSRLRK